MLGEWLRRTAFWTIDTVKGSKVKAHLLDIEAKMSNSKSTEPALNEMLAYVKQHVPFYKKGQYHCLTDFPVINKKCIMGEYDCFRSDEYRNNQELHEVATSGSSGNPFHAFQNSDKRNRVIAELMYVHHCVGWEIGDRYVFMRAWTGHYNDMSFQQFKQNFMAVEVTGFDRHAMDELRTILKKDHHIKVIIGYSSSLAELADYMLVQDDKPEMFSLKVIIADSDTLTPSGKKNLETVFGCPVISRYDNEEQGILAYTKPYSDEYVVNKASYYVEILSLNEDKPAKQGEIGRIVVTDMYNKAMPFIRYDTGDLAITGTVENGCCYTIKSLQGRTSDAVFAMDGTKVYSPSINNYICDFYDVKKYQLIQKNRGVFELLLVCKENSPSVKEIEQNIRKLLGQDVKLTIKVVEDIPNGKNGKYKTVVSEI